MRILLNYIEIAPYPPTRTHYQPWLKNQISEEKNVFSKKTQFFLQNNCFSQKKNYFFQNTTYLSVRRSVGRLVLQRSSIKGGRSGHRSVCPRVGWSVDWPVGRWPVGRSVDRSTWRSESGRWTRVIQLHAIIIIKQGVRGLFLLGVPTFPTSKGWDFFWQHLRGRQTSFLENQIFYYWLQCILATSKGWAISFSTSKGCQKKLQHLLLKGILFSTSQGVGHVGTASKKRTSNISV